MSKTIKETPLSFYSYIHYRLWEVSNKGKIERSFATNYLGQIANVEKKMRPVVIKELELLGLIKANKLFIHIKDPKTTKYKLLVGMYEKTGIWG